MRSLIFLGAGGNALEVLDVVEAINQVCPTWKVAGFLDDALPTGSRQLGLEVLGPLRAASHFRDHWFVNTIGSTQTYHCRPEILAATGLALEQFATLVYPTALVSSRAELGHGTWVNHGVSVGGNTLIGNHVSLARGCIISHDVVIEDYCLVAAGAVIGESVHVERGCFIGAGAAICPNVRIGAGALVGMGAVVVCDLHEWKQGGQSEPGPFRPIMGREPTSVRQS